MFKFLSSLFSKGKSADARAAEEARLAVEREAQLLKRVDQIRAGQEPTSNRWQRLQQKDSDIEVVMEVVEPGDVGQFAWVLEFQNLYHPVRDDETIGRDPNSCAVFISGDPEVSRRHASFQVDETGALMIRDEGATNATRVNGHPLDPGRWIKVDHGFQIAIGVRTVFIVRAGRRTAV